MKQDTTKYQNFHLDFESSLYDSVVILSLRCASESPPPDPHREDSDVIG